MWWTEDGERVLKGAEAKLFVCSVNETIEYIIPEDTDPLESGIKAFDTLTFGQQVSALAIVTKGFLLEDVGIVKLTAALDATIAAIYESTRESMAFECTNNKTSTHWRELVRNAREESGEEDLLDLNSDDVKDWLIEVECMREELLWDHDYSMIDKMLDYPPEYSKYIKKTMTIDPDYYIDPPYDLEDDEIATTLDEIRKLCKKIA